MNPTKFAVIRFKNRSGAISWRVDGHLDDVRYRKNFKTKAEGTAKKATGLVSDMREHFWPMTIYVRLKMLFVVSKDAPVHSLCPDTSNLASAWLV